MKKRFITNLALLVFLNLLIKPFWFFGIEVGVQNRVGEEMYGFYFSLFNFAFILNILLDVGINNFNNRAIARNSTLLRDHLAAIIPLKLFLSLIYAVVVFLLGKIIGYSSEQFRMLWVLVLNQFLASFILYFRTNISGLQYYRTDSLLSVMDRSLMILFTGLLLWGNFINKPFQIEWFVYAQTVSYTLTLITVALIVRYRSGSFIPRISLSHSMKILRQSYPFALLILLMALFNRVDSVMLERLLENGKQEAGIYAQSFRIFDAASQFSFLFAMLLLPMFSRMLRLKQDVNELIRMALPLLMVAGLSLAIASNYYNQEIIDLLYTAHAPYSSRIFGVLMIGFLFVSTSYIYGTLLTANNNLRQLNIVAASTVVINITLNLILIPRYQAYGAAISSLISQGYYALLQIVLSIRLVKIPLNVDILIKLTGFLAFNIITGYLTLLIPGWIPGFMLLLISCMASALLLGLIKPKELLSIVNSNEE
ncbi:MAG: polysaccharide biosynthesis C-terminal domain-containing protein [Bacteroidales bacterium]|nr:polysaccharide biosynthesis C-terminal domain-containing protein [Bacteroidales bacterium]